MWLHSLKVAQLLRSAACLHTNQSRSYLNHLVFWFNPLCTINQTHEAFYQPCNDLIYCKYFTNTLTDCSRSNSHLGSRNLCYNCSLWKNSSMTCCTRCDSKMATTRSKNGREQQKVKLSTVSSLPQKNSVSVTCLDTLHTVQHITPIFLICC